jgi:hypothetical protein
LASVGAVAAPDISTSAASRFPADDDPLGWTSAELLLPPQTDLFIERPEYVVGDRPDMVLLVA